MKKIEIDSSRENLIKNGIDISENNYMDFVQLNLSFGCRHTETIIVVLKILKILGLLPSNIKDNINDNK